jgi:hypothetical protein
MNKPPIASIINFCTIEARFIKACIEQCRHFSRQIIIPVCDHFFNGQPENRDLLRRIYAAFPDCFFIEYPFAVQSIPEKILKRVESGHFWHCVSRMIGTQYVDEGVETILFLDADELPEGKKFLEWLNSSDWNLHSVLKMANYWYFREPRYRSLNWEDSIVLAQKTTLDGSILLHKSERNAIYDLLPGPKRRAVTGLDGQPMFHHFSWIRTRNEMLAKVRAWGHRGDRDWVKLVDQEFSRPFTGKDFVHGYSFEECIPVFPVSLDESDFSPHEKKPLRFKRLEDRELLQHLGLRKSKWLRKFFNF